MMMVSMRPKIHVHYKIHEQGKITSFKFRLRPIESFDVNTGR
jgi:hypothetical protein